MPTTRSVKCSSPEKSKSPPAIIDHTNIKQESVTPPRFPMCGTPEWMKDPPKKEPRRKPPRQSSNKQSPFYFCPSNNYRTCHCEGLRIIIPPPSPSIPSRPKNLSAQFKHWDLKPKK